MPKKTTTKKFKTPDQVQFDNLIGINIARFRGFNRLSQGDLAEKIGTTAQTISEWENGRQSLSAYYLKRIALAFNINTEELLNFGDVKAS